MTNNLLDLKNNIDTILAVREKLLGDWECLQYRDVDTESSGYWVKVPVLTKDGEHKNAALGIYVHPGKGITVNFDSMKFYKKLTGVPSYEYLMDTIEEGMDALGYSHDA